MNITHVITGLETGGAERFLQRLLLHSAHMPGVNNSVISLSSLGVVGAELRDAGVQVTALGARRPLSMLQKLPALARSIRGSKPDIVQSWMYHADVATALIRSTFRPTPLVWNIRLALGPVKPTTRAVIWLAARLSGTAPDRIICCGEVVRADHARIGYADDRLSVIPNGYDLEHFKLTDAERNARLDAEHAIPVVAVAGRMDPQKDYANLVRAAAIMRERGVPARFVVAGAGCVPDHPQWRAWLADAGVADDFKLVGRIDDMRGHYASADLFCMSSLFEGFPNALAEAMAMELPCISTDAGDARMIAGDKAQIVPVANPERLADAMITAIALPAAARQTYGAAARARIAELFSLETAWNSYFGLYRSLTRSSGERS